MGHTHTNIVKRSIVVGQAICIIFAFISVGFYVHEVANASENKFLFDDAYMFIRYAKNFTSGHGLAWNPDGIQTYGTTSILYLFLIICLRSIWNTASDHSILVVGASCTGCLGIIALIVSAARSMTSQYIHRNRRNRWYSYFYIGSLLTLIIFWMTPFMYHSMTGMDTNLSLLCNTLLILSTLTWIYQKKKYGFALTVGAAYLSYQARPDNLLYAGLFPVLCILFLVEKDRKKLLELFLLSFCSILLVDIFLKLLIFKTPLPLSFYAKMSGYYDGYLGKNLWNPVTYLFQFGKSVFPFLLLILIFISKNSFKLCFCFLSPVILTFAYYFSVVQIMGTEARFYFPSLPFFVVGSVLIVNKYWQEPAQKQKLFSNKNGRIRVSIILLILICLSSSNLQKTVEGLYHQFMLSPKTKYVPSITYIIEHQQRGLPSLGWRKTIPEIAGITGQLPLGTTVAMSEYGFIGAKAPHIHILDPLGLHDVLFAHEGFSSDEFLAREPELIWMPHPHYTKINASILSSESFWKDYDFYPQLFDYGIAVKKNGPNVQQIYQTLHHSFNRTYGRAIDIKNYLAKPIINDE